MKYLLLILPFMWGCEICSAQNIFPKKPIIGMTYPKNDNWYLFTGKSWEPIYPLYDTSYGVLIWFDKNLLVRADSCMQIRVAYTNKTFGNNAYYDPLWLLTGYYLTKLKFEIDPEQVIDFKKKIRRYEKVSP